MLDSLARIARLEQSLDRWLGPQTSCQSEQEQADLASIGLLDFIPALTPGYVSPRHLWPLAGALERTAGEPVEYWFTVPPRHGKTETLDHGAAWALLRNPATRILYASHTATFARKQSKRIRSLASLVGVGPVDGSDRADEWENRSGGGLVARGVGGEVTGRGFDLILIDDPIKSSKAATSAIQREGVWDWLRADIFTRLEPGGSVVVVHTRWHPDDPIGHLISEGWPGQCIRAIAEPGDDDGRAIGEALWPERWSVEQLDRIRRSARCGEYNWASLYQGRPRPRGGTVFGEPHYYDDLPRAGYRIGHGCDLAYTAKTSADYSVVVTCYQIGDTLYVVDVQRKQVDAPAFVLTLKAQHSQHAGPMLWHASGTERGAAQFIQRAIPAFSVRNTTADKFVRAQPVAALWNDGKVLLPRDAKWHDVFVAEVCGFTGVGDVHDDQVDALASAHAALATSSTATAYRSGAAHRQGLPGRWI